MQVLGNAELRQRYDQHGAEGLDVNFMDGAEFFTMLFGSDSFEHLLGELMIAATARCASGGPVAQCYEECWSPAASHKGGRLASGTCKIWCSKSAKRQARNGSAWHRGLLDLHSESISLVQLPAAEGKGPAP